MNRRTLIILGAVLVGLVSLKLIQDASHRSRTGATGLTELVAGFSAGDLGGLEITGPAGGSVVLAQSGGEWTVESSYGHAADATKVERLTTALAGLKGEYRSDEPSVLADYGLADSNAVRLLIRDAAGGSKAELMLGNSVGGGFFVRRADERTAYSARGNLLSDLGLWGDQREPDGKRFLDLKVLSLNKDDVDRLVLTNGAERLELAKAFAPPAADSLPPDRADYSWRFGDGPGRKTTIESAVASLANVYARSVLDPSGDYGFEATEQKAELFLADGTKRTVKFGAKQEGEETGVPIRIDGVDHVYLVYESLPTRIFKARAEFMPEEQSEDD